VVGREKKPEKWCPDASFFNQRSGPGKLNLVKEGKGK
jgi:hypothetical protein